MTTDVDFTQAELDVLIELIRNDNGGQILTSSQVRFGQPQPFVPLPTVPKNTQIVMTAVEGGPYTGSRAFFYDRVQISSFVEWGITDLTFLIEEELTVADLLPKINERLSVNIGYDSVVNVDLPVLTSAQPTATIMLVIADSSVVYRGQLAIKIQRA